MGDIPSSLSEFLELTKQFGLEYFGLYYGQYRGVVVSNEDPQKLGRVQIRLPQIASDNKIEYWAWPAGQPTGEDFGDFMIPPKGSPVWVTFENGDSRYPVYMGGHWGKKAQAVPAASQGNPKRRTRSSEKFDIIMDDEAGSLKFQNKAGTCYIEITESGTINIRGPVNINMEGGASSSTIVMNDDDVTVMGWPFLQHTHVDVQAGGDVSGIVGGDGGGGGGGSGSGTGGTGSIKHRTEVNDTNYSIADLDDYLIAIIALTATRTMTLPSAAAAGENKKFLIKDESGSCSGTVKITISSADLIDGAASIDVVVPYGGLEVYSNGATYFSI